jgi:hypothetical protein
MGGSIAVSNATLRHRGEIQGSKAEYSGPAKPLFNTDLVKGGPRYENSAE